MKTKRRVVLVLPWWQFLATGVLIFTSITLVVLGLLLLGGQVNPGPKTTAGALVLAVALLCMAIVASLITPRQPSTAALVQLAQEALSFEEKIAEAHETMSISRSRFSEMGWGRKMQFGLFVLLGVVFLVGSILDFAGILPQARIQGMRDEVLLIPRWATGLVMLMVVILCALFTEVSRITVKDSAEEWRKLRAKFRLVVTDDKDLPQA